MWITYLHSIGLICKASQNMPATAGTRYQVAGRCSLLILCTPTLECTFKYLPTRRFICHIYVDCSIGYIHIERCRKSIYLFRKREWLIGLARCLVWSEVMRFVLRNFFENQLLHSTPILLTKIAMTGAIGEGLPEWNKSKQVLLTFLYSLQTQNRSLFLGGMTKTTNNELFYVYKDLNIQVLAS